MPVPQVERPVTAEPPLVRGWTPEPDTLEAPCVQEDEDWEEVLELRCVSL